MILVAAVISAYSMVRHTPLQNSPRVLTAMGEMNADIKRILDFTVGYYGSILQVTGNSTYAKGLTTSYISSGLLNIARSHPEWNPSFELNCEQVSTRWYMPQSYSMGNISVTYSLAGLGIEGVQYETSSSLEVTILESTTQNEARIIVTRDNAEPDLGLRKENFWFYRYNYADSTWELVNPTNDPVITSNGTYIIDIPSGVDQDAYSIQVEDHRGLMVPAFYSEASVDSGFPQFTYNFDWDSTGLLHIYESLSTDTMVIEVLQNGTLLWLGQSLQILPQIRPIPPLPIKALRLNQTINGVNQEVPFQVEDWASDYRIPLGLTGNSSLFNSNNMLVFLVNDNVEKATLWWDGSDTATQTSYAWQNTFFNDNPGSGRLDNGLLELDVHNFYVVSNVAGGSTSCTADFLRLNNEEPVFGSSPAYVIYNGIVRDIVQQEPEYGGGVPDSPNFYSQVVLTLPANATYYTYTARTIFVNSSISRTVSDLSAIQLSNLPSGTQLTENGTAGGYPETSTSTGLFCNDVNWDHHWSQFISGDSGAGLMFTDTDNQKLYIFDSIAGNTTGALSVSSSYIELNPVERYDANFTYPLDVTWNGAVVTFEGEPIYSSVDDVGLWVMVEDPPLIIMDGYDYDFVDNNICNVDFSDDKGSHSLFRAQKYIPDSIFDTLAEYMEGEKLEDYVDNDTSDVDSSEDIGSHSDFSAEQAGPDSVFDTLTEENTGPSSNFTLLDDGFEDIDWDVNWDDISSDWREDNYPVHGGYASAWASSWDDGYFTCDDLDASGATAIYVDFWFRKSGTESTDFTLYYYDGSGYDLIDELDDNGADNTWIHYTHKIIDSKYFVSNFRIRFDATLYYEDVWVDDVVITKEVQSSSNYELDLEVQFTDLVDFLPTEELCIYAGTLGDEDLKVDYWNGTDWENLATDLTADSWNNFTVSLTSTTFTVRFNGGNETDDTTQDQWEIDAVLIRSEGTGGKEDAVDNDTSDVDSSADKGSHSNFAAQQAGPDSVFDALTEENTSGFSNSTLLDDGFEDIDWDVNWDDISSDWREDNYPVHGGYASAWASSWDDGYFTCDDLDASGATAIYVDFWFRKSGTESTDFTLYYYDGSGYDLIDELDDNGADNTWIHYTHKIIDSKYFVSNFRIRFDATLYYEDVWVDDVVITKEVQSSDNYELDLEVQWTDLPHSLPNEELSIYGGSMGDEDILVDVWTGSDWETVFTDLSPGWNNVSITDWLTSSTFTIRFRDGTEVGDASQDTWEIDVALIHVWNVQGDSYELDLEVQFTNVDYDETYEELCIYGGVMGSEDIMVDVWTGSEWVNLFADLNSGWNNVTVSSYLTSETFTIRFKGGDEINDLIQDFWAIDATLLHIWS